MLACGDGALLSHRSAAILWGLRAGGGARVDVTTARRVGRGRAPIRVHWRPSVAAADACSCHGVPCTSVARTLLDLAAVVSGSELEKACDRAEQLRIFDGRAIDALLSRAQGGRGARRLRETLEQLDPQTALTRTEIERLMLALCKAHPLPQPVVNGWIQLNGIGFEPDFLLAPAAPDRRNRRRDDPPHPQGLRGRSPPRSAARRGRLHHAAPHLEAGHRRARARRKDDRRGAEACGYPHLP